MIEDSISICTVSYITYLVQLISVNNTCYQDYNQSIQKVV